MSEKTNQSEIKFTEEEMKQVQNIQEKYLSIQNQFGQLKLAQIRHQERELWLLQENENLEKSLKDIQNDEQKFLDEITKKYGQGTLNPESGVFTPNKS